MGILPLKNNFLLYPFPNLSIVIVIALVLCNEVKIMFVSLFVKSISTSSKPKYVRPFLSEYITQ